MEKAEIIKFEVYHISYCYINYKNPHIFIRILKSLKYSRSQEIKCFSSFEKKDTIAISCISCYCCCSFYFILLLPWTGHCRLLSIMPTSTTYKKSQLTIFSVNCVIFYRQWNEKSMTNLYESSNNSYYRRT